MKLPTFAGLALACLSLGACSTLGALPGASGSPTNADQLLNVLNAVNTAVSQNCSGGFSITWAPPLPPAGSANLSCAVKPPTMVPLSQISTLIGQAQASAATPAAPATTSPK